MLTESWGLVVATGPQGSRLTKLSLGAEQGLVKPMSLRARVDSAGELALIQIVVGVGEQTNHETPLFRWLIVKKEPSAWR